MTTNTLNPTSIQLTQVATLGDQKYPSFELRRILGYLKNQGHVAWSEQLLVSIGLAQEDLRSPFITAHQALRALNKVVEHFYRPGLGHDIASTYTLEDFDELGTCLCHAATLGEALFISNAYYDLVGSFNDLINVTDDDHHTQRLVNIARLDERIIRFLFELTVGGVRKLGEALSGQAVSFEVIRFDEPLSSSEKQLYRDLFHATIEDDAAFNEWVITQETLEWPIIGKQSDSPQSEENLKNLLALLKEDSGLVGDIDMILKGSAGDFPDPDMLSHALGISTRTLRRRLSKVGTSYSALIDKVRCQIALKLIQNRDFSNEEIAAELGYSDAANFCNAFKKWTGHAPSHYRV